MNHFIFPYHGNKRREYEHIKHYINLNGIRYIIEPFCGSSAISFLLWEEHPELTFFLMDSDWDLMRVYTEIKEKTPEEIKNNINAVLNIEDETYFKNLVEVYSGKKKISITKEKKAEIEANIYNFMVYKMSLKLGRIFEKRKEFKLNKRQLKFIEFIKSDNVHFLRSDWFQSFTTYCNTKDSLIILDPPYLMAYNGFYDLQAQMGYTNIYEYLADHKICNFGAKIMLVLEENWITRLLFKDFIKATYGKVYEMSKKKTKHIIICNY